MDRGWTSLGKFKKVKMKGKVSLIVTRRCELQCHRRLKKRKKRSMGVGSKTAGFCRCCYRIPHWNSTHLSPHTDSAWPLFEICPELIVSDRTEEILGASWVCVIAHIPEQDKRDQVSVIAFQNWREVTFPHLLPQEHEDKKWYAWVVPRVPKVGEEALE